MSKYLFDEQEISKELVILLSIFNASKENHTSLDFIANNNDLLPIFFTEWGIIQENLIASAIKLRIIDDQFKKYNKKLSFPNNVIGKLKEGTNKSKNLNLREACNKIIHTIKFSPKTLPENKPEREQYYLPKINLEGSKGKAKWKVEIDINKYVCDGLSLIKQYDEDWDISSR